MCGGGKKNGDAVRKERIFVAVVLEELFWKGSFKKNNTLLHQAV